MKNTLTDLNNYLFEQIERLNDDGLTKEELDMQLQKSEAINKVAKTIVDNANVALSAQKTMYEYGIKGKVEVPLLAIQEEGELVNGKK